MSALLDRDFPHRIALIAADDAWNDPAIAATDPMPDAGPYRGFVRLDGETGARYAYFGGRTSWSVGAAHVSEGYLFEVSARLRTAPKRYPSDSRAFRALGEATATDDPHLIDTLAKAYRP